MSLGLHTPLSLGVLSIRPPPDILLSLTIVFSCGSFLPEICFVVEVGPFMSVAAGDISDWAGWSRGCLQNISVGKPKIVYSSYSIAWVVCITRSEFLSTRVPECTWLSFDLRSLPWGRSADWNEKAFPEGKGFANENAPRSIPELCGRCISNGDGARTIILQSNSVPRSSITDHVHLPGVSATGNRSSSSTFARSISPSSQLIEDMLTGEAARSLLISKNRC